MFLVAWWLTLPHVFLLQARQHRLVEQMQRKKEEEEQRKRELEEKKMMEIEQRKKSVGICHIMTYM